MLVPACDLNQDPYFNYKAANELKAAGVLVKLTPHPSSGKNPYMHAKTILSDEREFYLGPQNFTHTSLHRNREIGLRSKEIEVLKEIRKYFEQDWQTAIDWNEKPPVVCPKFF